MIAIFALALASAQPHCGPHPWLTGCGLTRSERRYERRRAATRYRRCGPDGADHDDGTTIRCVHDGWNGRRYIGRGA